MSSQLQQPQGKYHALLGPAGSGKSYKLMRELEHNSQFALLTATTGVAALNLGANVTTLNSALGFYDLDSLKENYETVVRRFKAIMVQYQNLVIDEVSMLSADMLDLICLAYEEAIATSLSDNRLNFGLIVTGDFLQLPPVTGKFAFESYYWQFFAIEKLSKIHRQSDPYFTQALQAAREGKGVSCVQALAKCNVQFVNEPQLDFEGTTLYPTNPLAGAHNRKCYEALDTFEGKARTIRWGRQKSEWKLIPDVLSLKIGAEVMALSNYSERISAEESEDGKPKKVLVYANGSVGKVVDIIGDPPYSCFIVQFHKNRRTASVSRVVRSLMQVNPPNYMQCSEYNGPVYPGRLAEAQEWAKYLSYFTDYRQAAIKQGKSYFDPAEKRWVVGEIDYVPLQLAYAMTIHKSQGLTLDAAQIDARTMMSGRDASMYVAMSRVRSPEGLQVIGTRTTIAKRIMTNNKVRQFI